MTGLLPDDLLWIVLDFSGSTLIFEHRWHKFVTLEIKVYQLIHVTMIRPSRLLSFYAYHGVNRIRHILISAYAPKPRIKPVVSSPC